MSLALRLLLALVGGVLGYELAKAFSAHDGYGPVPYCALVGHLRRRGRRRRRSSSARSWGRPSPVWAAGSTGRTSAGHGQRAHLHHLRAVHRAGHRRPGQPGHQGPARRRPLLPAAALRRQRLPVRLPGLQAPHRYRPRARAQGPAAAARRQAVHPAQDPRHLGDHRRPGGRRGGHRLRGGRPHRARASCSRSCSPSPTPPTRRGGPAAAAASTPCTRCRRPTAT